MVKKKRIGRGYEEYEDYVIRASVYQKDTDALCDKAVFVQIYDPAPFPTSLFRKTDGEPYRRFSDTTVKQEDMADVVDDLKERAKNFIDNRLEEPDI